MRLHAIKSFYDPESGLVTLEDDVLGIVRQVNELGDGKIAINLDPNSGWYHFTEHCEDGTERLIFSTDELDGRALERLQRADNRWRGHEDPYLRAEHEQDEAQATIEAQNRERLAEAGERLAHAMKKTGMQNNLPLTVPVSRGKKRADG